MMSYQGVPVEEIAWLAGRSKSGELPQEPTDEESQGGHRRSTSASFD
jgi:hypothetical protein